MEDRSSARLDAVQAWRQRARPDPVSDGRSPSRSLAELTFRRRRVLPGPRPQKTSAATASHELSHAVSVRAAFECRVRVGLVGAGQSEQNRGQRDLDAGQEQLERLRTSSDPQ